MTEEQTHILPLLKIFSAICRENNLRYYLAGGTLLGAVRHKGFIPWDDDIDVSMPLDDFVKFQRAAEKLPENIVVQSYGSDPQYPFLFVKLCDISNPFLTENPAGPWGAYIDIFPLIPAKKLRKGTLLCFDTISVINYVLQVKLGWTSFVPYKKRVARAGFWLLNRMSAERLRKLREHLIRCIYDPDSRDTLCSPGGAYKADKEFFPAAWYDGTAVVEFEGELFPAPVGWQAYLSRNYGNYMELPPEEERCSRHK